MIGIGCRLSAVGYRLLVLSVGKDRWVLGIGHWAFYVGSDLFVLGE